MNRCQRCGSQLDPDAWICGQCFEYVSSRSAPKRRERGPLFVFGWAAVLSVVAVPLSLVGLWVWWTFFLDHSSPSVGIAEPTATAIVTPSPTEPVAPTTPAPTAPATAEPQVPVIPGLAAADVTLNAEDIGMSCDMTVFDDEVEWWCETSGPGFTFAIETSGTSPMNITTVSGNVLFDGDPSQAEAHFDEILGWLATLPYNGADPEAARTWVESATLGDEAVFGGARLSVAGEGTLYRTLTLSPAG